MQPYYLTGYLPDEPRCVERVAWERGSVVYRFARYDDGQVFEATIHYPPVPPVPFVGDEDLEW